MILDPTPSNRTARNSLLTRMPPHEPVRTPDEGSLEGVVAELENEVANLRAQLRHEQGEARLTSSALRRARIRADELQMSLQQKQEQFLEMLSRLQHREEQAVRRATQLTERTREAEAARVRAEEAEQNLRRMMGEAGKLLGASLDYRATLASVTRLATPGLADWCIIDVLDEQGHVERVAAAGAGEADEPLARRLVEECEPGGDYGVHRALGRGGRFVSRRMDEGLLSAIGCRPELLSALTALGLETALVVPMLARGHLVGAIALLTRSERRPYDEDDVLLAQELARRAALAVDNARLYDAALAGSRAKSEFLAVMSHELRTPLSAIIGYSDLLRTGVTGEVNAKQEQQLGRIRASADHLLELIEEILTFSQLEAGKAAVRPEPLDAAALSRDLCDLVRPLADRKGLELTLEGTDAAVPMTSDTRMLRQILLNLLSNAIKFTDEGEVRLVLEPSGERMRWRIRDTGMGIPLEHRQSIFTPFWQAEQSRTRRNEGSGLGLSVSRGLAELLGGEIDVESEPGSGSTFTLEVPAEFTLQSASGPEER